MSTTDKLFVYGTLRGKGEATHSLMDHALYNAGPFPYIRPAPTWDVYGSVIEVTPDELRDMDRYEGIERGLYTRQKLKVHNNDTDEWEMVWVYVGGSDWPELIESGDWYERG